ncbi:hypothetical protein GGF44_004745, partial [Coemansia sp. RSA 1694]
TPMSVDALVSLASQSLSAAIASAKDGARLPTASATMAGGEEGEDEDEDDSWLALNPDELDDMMRKAESILKDAAQ